jgi:hypothetical protein
VLHGIQIGKFSGGTVDFGTARSSGGTVDFSQAGEWSSPPVFPGRVSHPRGVKLPSEEHLLNLSPRAVGADVGGPQYEHAHLPQEYPAMGSTVLGLS